MAKIVDMPKLSPTMEEGQIGSWHKGEGDAINVDDLLAEVETDKATMEFRSFDKGTLLKILVPAGSVVKLGQPVAIVGQKGEDIGALLSTVGGGAPATSLAPAAPAAPAAPTTATSTSTASQPSAPVSQAAAGGGRVKASPYVRRLARERGLSLQGVAGSGPHGRIVAKDVDGLSASPTASAASPAPTARTPEVRKLSMMRKTIAKRLTQSKTTVPHFYLTIDVDAEPLHLLRERVNADLLAGDAKANKLSFNDFLIKAVAIGLRRVPTCNAQFTDDAILIFPNVDISVAVAVEDGLVTPVVRDADTKSVAQIAAEVRDLAGRAKEKKLRPEEMTGGTFSISNLGMFGIDEFSAVINPPEGAILAVGQVRREPVVVGDQVVPGRRLNMTMSCDHRVIDGAVGATFLKALRGLVEHPAQILVL